MYIGTRLSGAPVRPDAHPTPDRRRAYVHPDSTPEQTPGPTRHPPGTTAIHRHGPTPVSEVPLLCRRSTGSTSSRAAASRVLMTSGANGDAASMPSGRVLPPPLPSPAALPSSTVRLRRTVRRVRCSRSLRL